MTQYVLAADDLVKRFVAKRSAFGAPLSQAPEYFAAGVFLPLESPHIPVWCRANLLVADDLIGEPGSASPDHARGDDR